MKATWNGQVVAESNDIVTVEGNAYFPAASLKQEFVAQQPYQRLPLEGHG